MRGCAPVDNSVVFVCMLDRTANCPWWGTIVVVIVVDNPWLWRDRLSRRVRCSCVILAAVLIDDDARGCHSGRRRHENRGQGPVAGIDFNNSSRRGWWLSVVCRRFLIICIRHHSRTSSHGPLFVLWIRHRVHRRRWWIPVYFLADNSAAGRFVSGHSVTLGLIDFHCFAKSLAASLDWPWSYISGARGDRLHHNRIFCRLIVVESGTLLHCLPLPLVWTWQWC